MGNTWAIQPPIVFAQPKGDRTHRRRSSPPVLSRERVLTDTSPVPFRMRLTVPRPPQRRSSRCGEEPDPSGLLRLTIVEVLWP
jgi:hypothetical protein